LTSVKRNRTSAWQTKRCTPRT